MCVCEYIQGHVCASVHACLRTSMPCVRVCVCVCVRVYCVYLCVVCVWCAQCFCEWFCHYFSCMVLIALTLTWQSSILLYELVLFCFFSRSWYKIVLQMCSKVWSHLKMILRYRYHKLWRWHLVSNCHKSIKSRPCIRNLDFFVMTIIS